MSRCALGLAVLALPLRLCGQSSVPLPGLAECATCDIQPLPAYDSRNQWQPHFEARPAPALALKEHAASPFALLGLGVTDQGQSQQTPPAGNRNEQPIPLGNQKPKNQHSPTATTGSPGHIFWVVPAFKVDYQHGFKPLTAKEKFQEWAQGAYDPLGLGTGAFEAGTLEYSSKDGFCGYGGGFAGYGKCFGSLELDADVSSVIGDFALTVALHQDPRYFRLGKGSFGRRLGYAVSRVFVTYNDSGRTVVYSSALTGTAAAAAISNLYYPAQDVGFGHTMSRIAIDLGNTALYNAAAEFWPDVHRKLQHIF